MNNIRFLLTDDNEFSYDTEKSYNQIKEELLTTGKFSFDDGYGTVYTYFKNSLIYMEYIDNSMDVKEFDLKKYYYDIYFSCDTYESVALLTPFEEFCKLIVENETIELSDEDSHLFFFSKYVTYIEWDSKYDDMAEEDRVEEKEEERKYEEQERTVLIPLKREILSYELAEE